MSKTKEYYFEQINEDYLDVYDERYEELFIKVYYRKEDRKKKIKNIFDIKEKGLSLYK